MLFSMRPPIVLFFLFQYYASANEIDVDILKDIHRILHKRDIASNIAMDDPTSKCRNGGIFSQGICHCIHPNTGNSCEHFQCDHGISVGFRYDPESLLFGSPCICDEGWKGELCDFKPVDKCNNRGEFKSNRCECHGYFFGHECQYTSRCIEGNLKHGRCICRKGFEGDYCDRIVCDFGTPNFQNKSMSCICPEKYAGRHCNRCKRTGPLIEPYPLCSINLRAKKTYEMALKYRKSKLFELRKRMVLVGTCLAILAVCVFIVRVLHFLHKTAIRKEQSRRQTYQAERHRLLSNRVRLQKMEEEVAESLESVTSTRGERRKSEPMLIRMVIRKKSTQERKSSDRK